MDTPGYETGRHDRMTCLYPDTDECTMEYCAKRNRCIHPDSGPHSLEEGGVGDDPTSAEEEMSYNGVPLTLREARVQMGLCGNCGKRWSDDHGYGPADCEPNTNPLPDLIPELEAPTYRKPKGQRFEGSCLDGPGDVPHPQVEAKQNDIQVTQRASPTRPRIEVNGDGSITRIQKDPAPLPTDSEDRKHIPMARGVLDYFPAALAEVARLSQAANEKHNPGEPMHWSRGKSNDHADCLLRHLVERGTTDDDGFSHTAKVAWRALALLQEELEQLQGAPLPRGARTDDTEDTNGA